MFELLGLQVAASSRLRLFPQTNTATLANGRILYKFKIIGFKRLNDSTKINQKSSREESWFPKMHTDTKDIFIWMPTTARYSINLE